MAISCVIVFVILCLLGILFWFTLVFITGVGAGQKHNRKKIRETADQVISGEKHIGISEINKLIDGLDRYYKGNLIRRSEEDHLVRINKLRVIRNDI